MEFIFYVLFQDGIIQPYFDRKASMPPMPEDSPFVEGFSKLFQAFTDSVKSYADRNAYEKIARWDLKKLMTSMMDIATPMKCGFQVLNHGDSWINNMMFKSDEENNPIDVNLIDFQMSFWASPSCDLLYFLFSSVADDIKAIHFDHFIEFYHDQLTSALKKLKFDQHIPTLTELHIDLLDKGSFGMF